MFYQFIYIFKNFKPYETPAFKVNLIKIFFNYIEQGILSFFKNIIFNLNCRVIPETFGFKHVFICDFTVRKNILFFTIDLLQSYFKN